MGHLRFRRSVKIAPGLRLNLNKKSMGLTAGGKGFHYSVNTKGRRTTTVGLPGTGLSYQSVSSAKGPRQHHHSPGRGQIIVMRDEIAALQPPIVYCGDCGAQNMPAQRYCGQCGEPLPEYVPSARGGVSPLRVAVLGIVLLMAASALSQGFIYLVLLGAVGALVYFVFRLRNERLP